MLTRDMELVREVLLRVEALSHPPGTRGIYFGGHEEFQIDGYEPDAIEHHMRLLVDAGFIKGKLAGQGVMIECLTWEGHEFLDSIRSPEIWRDTKAAASKVGSVSLRVVGEIAVALGKSVVKQHTGLDF
jgi:hypothetical protein